ncbi:MAG: hypothetical protein HW406_1843 [Candidatus Brocadiaceae bacterium]|nr:hypothetical protein [Candidatus Brocadiaceae bacterium]
MKIFRLSYILPVIAGLGLSLGSSAWALTHHEPGDTTKSPYTIFAGLGFAVQESCYYCHGVCLILLTLLSNLQKQMNSL